jgi:hypothetical protein
MGFVKRGLSTIDLTGFWTRTVGTVLTGKVVKFVPNNKDPKHVRPFFIFCAEDSPGAFANIEGQAENVAIKAGDYIGVAANWAITSQLDSVKDIGKRVRLTVDGEKENPNGGKPMVMITVEIDE